MTRVEEEPRSRAGRAGSVQSLLGIGQGAACLCLSGIKVTWKQTQDNYNIVNKITILSRIKDPGTKGPNASQEIEPSPALIWLNAEILAI